MILIIKRILVFCMVLLFCGCGAPMTQKFDALRARNRSNLNKLQLGMSRTEVVEIMGQKTDTLVSHNSEDGGSALRPVKTYINNPYRTSSFEKEDKQLEVLYYYTEVKDLDGAISDDELVPIVLVDNKLVGWGWDYWKDVAEKYEIRIR